MNVRRKDQNQSFLFGGDTYQKRDLSMDSTRIKVYMETIDDGVYLVRDKFKRLWLKTLLWDKVYEFYEVRFELVHSETDADELYKVSDRYEPKIGRPPYFYVSGQAIWELHT